MHKQVNYQRLKLSQILRESIHLLLSSLQNPFLWSSSMRIEQALWMTVQNGGSLMVIVSSTQVAVFEYKETLYSALTPLLVFPGLALHQQTYALGRPEYKVSL